jgi:hypothetical protein
MDEATPLFRLAAATDKLGGLAQPEAWAAQGS